MRLGLRDDNDESEWRPKQRDNLLIHPALLKAEQEQEDIQALWIQRRIRLGIECDNNQALQAAVIKQCQEDFVFFFNLFAWTDDPRGLSDEQISPLILYDFQVELLDWIQWNIESTQVKGIAQRRNLLVEKTRDMGVSWVVFTFLLWWWRFKQGKFLILSRKAEEVDVRGDMDTPFEKLRWALGKWPEWLMPLGFDWRKHDKYMLLKNPAGGQIVGESANKSASRGGRCLMAVFDEHPVMGNDEQAWRSAAGSTKVRLSIGTPAGPYGKYYELATGDKEEVEKKRLHWVIHPIKGAGATYDENGNPTSPWYEAEKRGLNAEEIAGELDIDYNASVKGVVYPDYKLLHRYGKRVDKPSLKPETGTSLLWVLDPGVTFAASLMQLDQYNRVSIFREIIEEEALLISVANKMIATTREFFNLYGEFEIKYAGDPSGESRSGAGQDRADYVILREDFGMNIDTSFMFGLPPALKIPNRIQAVHSRLQKMVMTLKTPTPSLLVDVDYCPTIDEAMCGHYRYKVNKQTKSISGEPEHKQPWCDAADTVGYGVYYYMGATSTPKQLKRQENEDERKGYAWNGQRRARRY